MNSKISDAYAAVIAGCGGSAGNDGESVNNETISAMQADLSLIKPVVAASYRAGSIFEHLNIAPIYNLMEPYPILKTDIDYEDGKLMHYDTISYKYIGNDQTYDDPCPYDETPVVQLYGIPAGVSPETATKSEMVLLTEPITQTAAEIKATYTYIIAAAKCGDKTVYAEPIITHGLTDEYYSTYAHVSCDSPDNTDMYIYQDGLLVYWYANANAKWAKTLTVHGHMVGDVVCHSAKLQRRELADNDYAWADTDIPVQIKKDDDDIYDISAQVSARGTYRFVIDADITDKDDDDNVIGTSRHVLMCGAIIAGDAYMTKVYGAGVMTLEQFQLLYQLKADVDALKAKS